VNLPRRLLALGSAALLAGSLSACGTDAPTAQTPNTATPATSAPATPGGTASPTGTLDTCAAADQARLALADVGDVNIIREGVDAFKAKVATFQSDVDATIEAARADFATEAQAARTSMDALDAAVKELGASPSATSLKNAGTALTNATSSVTQLVRAIDDAC
jgi:hypothetical protein